MRRHENIFFCILIFISINTFHVSVFAQERSQQLISSTKADTWVATDALGRSLVTGSQGGTIRKDKFVGIFYFVWHGAHGYDKGEGKRANGNVLDKLPSDTVSPYDINKIIAKTPDDPKYGPDRAWHYWAEPYFGYYLPDDEWIIRKHGQMLSDAGVDVIIFDVTNAFIYFQQVAKIAKTYEAMRKEGMTTPSIAFMTNAAPERQVQRLYDTIYKKGLFKDLWFYWKGKPLILSPPEGLNAETKDFFTVRQSWAWKDHWNNWFGNGKDKWPWMDHTPQAYGWHESPEKPEEISVCIAEHPIYFDVGRSFHHGAEPKLDKYNLTPYTALGLHFEEQWKRALEVDPEFVFITGWNEWVAMRFKSDRDVMFLENKPLKFAGKPIKKGDTYFVDEYNKEFSRDAEPMKGGFGDDYYYQMVNFIRKYKGSRPVPQATINHNVKVDGKFADWSKVMPVFHDDEGDTFHRKHAGWGRIKEYVNNTGRNDIIEAKAANDKKYIFFYVKTASGLTQWNDRDWMNLYIKVKGDSTGNREGFNYRINANPLSKHVTSLEGCQGDWKWKKIANISYAYQGNELELNVPKQLLKIHSNAFTLDFKWTDNSPVNGDLMNWWDKGDAAPNGRFCYRYIKK